MAVVFDPSIGVQRPHAWKVAHWALADGDWLSEEELIDFMVDASQMKPKSCETLLLQARRGGVLERTPQKKRKRSRPAKWRVNADNRRAFDELDLGVLPSLDLSTKETP